MKLYFASGSYLAFVDNLHIVKEETGIDPFPAKILVSYLDVMNKPLSRFFERWFKDPSQVELFLDSGAFGAHSRRLLLDVKKYGEYVLANKDWIHVYANLDVIHSPEETMKNQKMLEDMGLSPLPIYHAPEPFEIWQQITEKYDYACLGALVSGRLPVERDVRVRQCMTEASKNNTKVHLFGIGNVSMLSRFEPYSADSTSFIQSKYGRIVAWDERDMTVKKIPLRSPELISYEHVFARYGLPTTPLFARRPGKYGYTVIRAFEYLQFQRMGDWLDAIWKYRDSHPQEIVGV
jgi:hypothetical protein